MENDCEAEEHEFQSGNACLDEMLFVEMEQGQLDACDEASHAETVTPSNAQAALEPKVVTAPGSLRSQNGKIIKYT